MNQTKRRSIAQPPFRYVSGYLSQANADSLLAELDTHTAWQCEHILMFGKRVPVPRQVAWFGNPGVVYRYSGLDHEAKGWPASLEKLRSRISRCLGIQPDFALLNRYEDGAQYMGWHVDDEPSRGDHIASVSLGAARRFLVRADDGPSTPLILEHGSLLVLHKQLPHCLPRTRKPSNIRINITFRSVA